MSGGIWWNLNDPWRVTRWCHDGEHDQCDRVDCCCVVCHEWVAAP